MAASIIDKINYALGRLKPTCGTCPNGPPVTIEGVFRSDLSDTYEIHAKCHGWDHTRRLDAQGVERAWDLRGNAGLVDLLLGLRFFPLPDKKSKEVESGVALRELNDVAERHHEELKARLDRQAKSIETALKEHAAPRIWHLRDLGKADAERATELREIAAELRGFMKRFAEAKYDDERMRAACELLMVPKGTTAMCPPDAEAENMAHRLHVIAAYLDGGRK